MKILVVVDMQNDFVSGSLKNKEAIAIVPKVVEKVKNFDGQVIFTRDTHTKDYLETKEGKNLPVEHCIAGTDGWNIISELLPYANFIFNKGTFGCTSLANYLATFAEKVGGLESVEFIGVCTDICVISNVLLLKASVPEIDILVDASCCAGVTPQKHLAALDAMESCQIIIENR